MIELGSKVKDTISGLVGIAVAKTEWLHGCVRLTIQQENMEIDRPLLEKMERFRIHKCPIHLMNHKPKLLKALKKVNQNIKQKESPKR